MVIIAPAVPILIKAASSSSLPAPCQTLPPPPLPPPPRLHARFRNCSPLFIVRKKEGSSGAQVHAVLRQAIATDRT
ncbi:uncharacterized protein BDR25DRAFT_303901 [Lindgomyces ingoldianus]|uniref:Uncharacterized protein n=1 Tax=Lindgomyces ingoldianus TaxID=673940 RepID=A0ACB6QTS1_9PLEO|nr:uncharacterized protein BDR25DRAFT_303901 [Lindgomyces ingoldianus]KAF2470399.1 hypothetical protein BDR25DRAFT_303901 [Lindgomyces ingoldianus]